MAEPGFEPRKTGSRVHAIKYYIMVRDVEKEGGEEAVWAQEDGGSNGQIS